MTVKPGPRQLSGRDVRCEQMPDLGRLDLDESFGVSATEDEGLIRRYWASLTCVEWAREYKGASAERAAGSVFLQIQCRLERKTDVRASGPRRI